MGLLQEIILTESVVVAAPPEAVFGFLTGLVDDASYRAWHPEDHVALGWLEGPPWTVGSIGYAEEYFHGKRHKARFRVERVLPDREIEFVPVRRVLRVWFPRNRFVIDPDDQGAIFTAHVHLRVGRLGKRLFRRTLETGLAGVRKHMKQEGENLKRLLEGASIGPEVPGCSGAPQE